VTRPSRLLDELLTRTRPDVVYHYTSQQGLLGVIQRQAVWAGEIHYLNDSQEFEHAIGVARQVLEAERRSERNSEERAMLLRLEGVLDQYAAAPVFAASFSAEPDLLSQWRAYCPPGAGYSIGFDTATLSDIAATQGFSFVPCVYEADLQRALIAEAVAETMAAFSDALQRRSDLDPSIEESARGFAERVVQLAPMLKHPTFEEEKEWRLASGLIDHVHPEVHHRAGKSMLIPYYIMSLARASTELPIVEVRVGPTPHPELAVASTFSMLKKVQARPVVTRSGIPYRDW
jgi:hypothetical protein